MGFKEEAAVYRALVEAGSKSKISQRNSSVKPAVAPRNGQVAKTQVPNRAANLRAKSTPKVTTNKTLVEAGAKILRK